MAPQPHCSVLLLASLLLLLTPVCLANVEKTIFLAPPGQSLPNDASIDNLYHISLSDQHPSVRTKINASFPTDDHLKGTETWMLLEDLSPGSRYEVRICWLATQPTTFWLYTHDVPAAFATPELISSLSTFAYARQAELTPEELDRMLARRIRAPPDSKTTQSSMLFLQIYAAANYFTLNQTLMQTVPPVLVDVILDRYLLNIFPRSLVSTGIYILILAALSWPISSWIWRYLLSIAQEASSAVSSTEEPSKKKS